MTEDLIEPRRDYTADTLSRSELQASPIEQFRHWMQHARDAKILDASAMAIATADKLGQPHVRMVLLKKFDQNGFVWYTYQESDKGAQLAENPKASILFYWRELERQVRIEGSVVRLDPADADEYFYTRPEGSRFSAAASTQSALVSNRGELEQKVAELHQQYPDGNVPRPAVWGGYSLQPERFEFWQGRADRLHDRFVYLKDNNAKENSADQNTVDQNTVDQWRTQRISP